MLRIYAEPGLKELWSRNDSLGESEISRLSRAELYWKDSFRIMKQTRLSFLNNFTLHFGRSTGSVDVITNKGIDPEVLSVKFVFL